MIQFVHARASLAGLLIISLCLTLPIASPPATAKNAVCPPVPASDVIAPAALIGTPNVIECELVGVSVKLEAVQQSVEIPPPGGAISIFVLTADPSLDHTQTSLTVAVAENGDLSLPTDEGPESQTVMAGSDNPCLDGAYNLDPLGSMKNGETFKINKSSVPNNVNTANAVAAIEDGMRAWPQLHNDCGLPDNVDVTVQYGGDTSDGTSSDPDPGAGCNFSSGAYDQNSVVGFGELPDDNPDPGDQTVLGRTCRYHPPLEEATAADIRLNNESEWTTTPGTCSNAFDVESVVAHEAGHWWGLAHVSSPRLTMAGYPGADFECTLWMRTLGWGDVRGMNDLY